MADKNIQIKKSNGLGGWDNLYPITKGSNVVANDGTTTFERHLADNTKQIPHLGTTTNSGDAYSITTTETINANQKFTIKFNAASTSAPTLKINSGTAYAVKKANGNNAKLYASVYALFWDGTNFIQLGEGGEYGTATAGQVLAGYTIGTDAGLVSGGIPNYNGTNQLASSNWISGTTLYFSPIPEGFYPGGGLSGVCRTDPNFVASNILNGVSIFGLTGSAISGKRSASGTATGDANNFISVFGLTFRPSLVFAWKISSSTSFLLSFYSVNMDSGYYYRASLDTSYNPVNIVSKGQVGSDPSWNIGAITNDGFKIGGIQGNTYNYIAFE